ncbi:uncharacterized protein CIMG_06793 [Coccidioides immitis RS]|uniref:Uncharacterized protein n=1 Tax=Coccidioides immitis (strain RS) TaxID=246410 RepID=J3K8X9_COCIM|nr:uncharacterized protein CIMG_06793 [Coccidioides immitis RS]EAS31314.3 hypothetical protein CIMG_06793 [Coccidioides immitis RS]
MSAALPLQRRYLVMRSASALCRHGREKVPEGKFLDLAAGCLWKLRLIYVKDEFGYYDKVNVTHWARAGPCGPLFPCAIGLVWSARIGSKSSGTQVRSTTVGGSYELRPNSWRDPSYQSKGKTEVDRGGYSQKGKAKMTVWAES